MLTRTKTPGIKGSNRLLAALSPADFSVLAPNLKDISLAQGDVLQEAGEAIKYVFFPHSGMISFLVVMQNGSAIDTATVGREGATGAMSGLGSRIAPHRAVVQIDGIASRIAAARFETAVNGSAALKDLLVRYSDFLMMTVHQSAGCNALHAVEARLCRWLLQACDRIESNQVSLTHEFLSQMLGVRRPTLTLIANDIQTAGLIRYHRGNIEIMDRSGLEAKACECYAAIRQGSEQLFL